MTEPTTTTTTNPKSLGFDITDPFGINNTPPSQTQTTTTTTNDTRNASNLLLLLLWPYIGAGILGSALSDSAMHSLDTIKTRQQAAPHHIKYQSTTAAYMTILKEEGFLRGWYAGYGAAMLGSVPRGILFFGTYEFLKREMISTWGVNETVTHLTAGMMGDLVTSVVFVPSEVLKTRLQLQGRHNNPFFNSGYNYKGLWDAIVTIASSKESNSSSGNGWRTFYQGYRATLCRDLPFSAMQFAFYEKFRKWAMWLEDTSSGRDLSMVSELVVGGMAGGLTGVLTTPLDVFKTRLQTQNPSLSSPANAISNNNNNNNTGKQPTILTSPSVLKGLKTIYQNEGFKVLFSGVQPRLVWTSVQSSIMLLVYQQILKLIDDFTEKRSKTATAKLE